MARAVMSSSGAPGWKRLWEYGGDPAGNYQCGEALEVRGEVEGGGLVLFGQEAEGNLAVSYSDWKSSYKAAGARLISLVADSETWCSGCASQLGRFRLDIRKLPLTRESGPALEEDSQGDQGISILCHFWGLVRQSDTISDQPLAMALFQGGLEKGPSQVPFGHRFHDSINAGRTTSVLSGFSRRASRYKYLDFFCLTQ